MMKPIARLTAVKRARLQAEMEAVEYRAQLFRRIFLFLCLAAAACFTSCSSPKIESRRAILAASDRGSGGRYVTPHCPLCGAPPVLRWTGWHCGHGHTYETPGIDLSH